MKEVYPVKNMIGNDNQVISVCDQTYYMYTNGEHGVTLCTIQLY